MFEEFVLEKQCTSISPAIVGIYKEWFKIFIMETKCTIVKNEDIF